MLNAGGPAPWYYSPITLFARNDSWDHSPPQWSLDINDHCLDADVCTQYLDQLLNAAGAKLSPTRCN